MKNFKASAILMLAIGLLMYACNPDGVAPKEGGNGNPSLSGSMGDPHPALDTICQKADTMFLIREDDGSEYVNKCFGPAGQITCAPGQMKWGYMEMVEGYFGDTSFVDCNFTMAPGWYCDFNNWEIGIGTEFQFDQNGVPIVGQDWGNLIVNPVQNKWQLRIHGADLPSAFDVALRVSAVRLNLFGAVTPNSNTMLWGKNRQWNSAGSPYLSVSPWLMHFNMMRCMTSTPPPPVVDTTTFCAVVYTGLTCTGNSLGSTVLHPVATEASGVTYAWSHNGSTSQDITVSPTVNTSYTSTVSVDGVAKHVVIFNVNVIDVSCNVPVNNGGGNGNGGSGSGYGGGGCGNGGSGSGNSNNGNSICGNVDQVTSYTGASNTSNVLGSSNNSGTSLTSTGHKITIKLDHTLPAGTEYKIYWKKSGSGTASLKVSESQSNSSYTQNGNAAITTTSTSYVTKTLTTTGATRYLKLESMSSTDLYVDAVTYCYTPVIPTVPGVKVCHVPPGNPGGATTVCVSYTDLSSHVTGVCPSNGGGNGGGWSGGGNGHGCGGHASNCNGRHSGNSCNNGGHTNSCNRSHSQYAPCNWGGHKSGCNHSHSGGNSNCNNGGHQSGCDHRHSGNGGNNCNRNNKGNCSSSNTSHGGGGCQGSQGGGHTGDMIGACNSNPCL